MKSNLLLVVLTLVVLVVALHFVEKAASSGPRVAPDVPETLAEERQFDFWLGDWDLTWGKGEKGTNSIRSILGGCIVQENFVATSGDQTGFAGMSVSAYSKEHGKWLQTWVDNQGGYLDFTGGYKDNKMTLSRKAVKGGKEFIQRMVWQDISRDSLNWFWERSENDGKTWTTVWMIHYQRKGGTG